MKKIILMFISTLLLGSCVSYGALSEAKKYESEKFSSVNSWKIEFEYEFGSVEETKNNDGNTETTTKKSTYAANLQLLDDIYFYLLDNNTKISKTDANVDGFIRITPVYDLRYSYFSSIRIVLYDSMENILGRIKIDNTPSSNGPSTRLQLNDTKLAIFCGEEIIKLIEDI